MVRRWALGMLCSLSDPYFSIATFLFSSSFVAVPHNRASTQMCRYHTLGAACTEDTNFSASDSSFNKQLRVLTRGDEFCKSSKLPPACVCLCVCYRELQCDGGVFSFGVSNSHPRQKPDNPTPGNTTRGTMHGIVGGCGKPSAPRSSNPCL